MIQVFDEEIKCINVHRRKRRKFIVKINLLDPQILGILKIFHLCVEGHNFEEQVVVLLLCCPTSYRRKYIHLPMSVVCSSISVS